MFCDVFQNSNTTGITSDAGTGYPSGAPAFVLGFFVVQVLLKLLFSV